MVEEKKKAKQQNEEQPMQDLEGTEHTDQLHNDYKNEYYKEDEDEDEFEREFYEPAITSTTTNIIGWTIAVILFILAIWLLWIALK